MMKYWINTIYKNHVMVGKQEGFVQAGHGKEAAVKKLQLNDRMIFYSPKTSLQDGKPVQAFTAVAKIKDNNIYPVLVNENFWPYRRNAEYENCQEVPIKPLIEQLEFITNKKHWSLKFSSSLFEINQHNFELIYKLMKDFNCNRD